MDFREFERRVASRTRVELPEDINVEKERASYYKRNNIVPTSEYYRNVCAVDGCDKRFYRKFNNQKYCGNRCSEKAKRARYRERNEARARKIKGESRI